MSQESPPTNFLKALETYIDARIEKAMLSLRRLHARELAAATTVADEACATSKESLEAAITELHKDFRRPGI